MEREQLHVLVVDGAEDFGAIVREVLEEEGYRVTATTEPSFNPGDRPPDGVDLVVFDPGSGENLDGWFLRTLEHDHEGRRIPVAICAGNTQFLRNLADALALRDTDVVP